MVKVYPPDFQMPTHHGLDLSLSSCILKKNIKNMKQLNIATLDFHHWTQGGVEQKNFFLSEIGTALSGHGFFFLKNSGLDLKLLEEGTKAWKKFLTLPEEERMNYVFNELKNQVGYTPHGVEKGEFAAIADTKCFWQTNPDYEMPKMSKGVEEFSKIDLKVFYEFERVGRELLRAIAITIDLPIDFFDKKIGNSVLRNIFYPANANPMSDDTAVARGGNIIAMCASRHTDINFITLLEALEKGLQLRHGGKWYEITITEPGLIIVNCGDMLEHFTAGLYKSGEHRVVCEPNKERFSRPFFLHVKRDVIIIPPEIKSFDREKYPFTTAGEYLDFRLDQIGLG